MEFYGQKNIKGQLPILIGTIPVKSSFNDFITVKKKGEDSDETNMSSNGNKIHSFGASLGYPDLGKFQFLFEISISVT